MIRLLPIDAGSYVRSPLHGEDRVWQETNCYVDIWIETLHALGLDPVAGLAFTLSADFDGDQWQFIKFPLEDLRSLYGLGVSELNPWKGLEHHIVEQLEMGRLLTAEVNSYFLPDTAGVAYKIEDVKSSIVANVLDPDARRLGYFHNASYFELEGDDYDGLFRGAGGRANALPPYVELIRLEGMIRREGADLTEHAVELVRDHLARRPSVSPVQRMAKRFDEDVEWLGSQGMEMFHLYAFATARQCGATAELASSLCEWLTDRDIDAAASRDSFARVSSTAKAVQFKFARLAAGRQVDVAPLFEEMDRDWTSALDALTDLVG